MKVITPNSSQNSIEVEVSIKELERIETALSYARRSLSEAEVEKVFGENLELSYLITDVQEAIKDFEKTKELSPKEQLRRFVAKFKKWVSDNYSAEKIRDNLIDDAGYPHWTDIESYYRNFLKNNSIEVLDKEDKLNLLYLIARNWDIGSMINWFSSEKRFSSCGNLSDKDFIDLARILAEQKAVEFEDSKVQFASSFKKFESLTPEIEAILLRLYETRDEYAKRHALISLAKLGYRETKALVEKSWETEDEEFHKIACLEIIREDLKDEEMFKEYLEKASLDNRQNISEFVNKIKNPVE